MNKIETAGKDALQKARDLALKLGKAWPSDSLEISELEEGKGVSVCARWRVKRGLDFLV
jgi:hypothetical protein